MMCNVNSFGDARDQINPSSKIFLQFVIYSAHEAPTCKAISKALVRSMLNVIVARLHELVLVAIL